MRNELKLDKSMAKALEEAGLSSEEIKEIQEALRGRTLTKKEMSQLVEKYGRDFAEVTDEFLAWIRDIDPDLYAKIMGYYALKSKEGKDVASVVMELLRQGVDRVYSRDELKEKLRELTNTLVDAVLKEVSRALMRR